MEQHSRKYTARATRGSRHDLTTTSILLRDRQRIGIDQSAALDATAIPFCPDHVIGGFSTDSQATGQDTLCLQTTTHSRLHHLPHFGEIVPDLLTFALLHILPEGIARAIAPCLYILYFLKPIDLSGGQLVERLIRQGSTTNAIHRPSLHAFAILGKRLEQHAIRMERQEQLRLPDNLRRSHWLQHLQDCGIGHVAFSRSGQAAV